MNSLRLLIEVPICAFRPYTSREYQDTYPVPTPSAVYGMLLSLVGIGREGNLEARQKARTIHRGVEMALAVEREPKQSRVFRKMRRGELDAKRFPALSEDERILSARRPDYQDLLLDLRLWVWLRPGNDRASPTLPERVKQAVDSPASVTRSGGLSLGESSYLVDTLCIDPSPPERLIFVVPDELGFYSLPVWVDHLVRTNTVMHRFRLSDLIAVSEGLPSAWTPIGGKS